MANSISREQAWELLTKYNKDSYHLAHATTVESVMRYFAEKLGYSDQADYWGIVGLLHDLDYEMFPEAHCLKQPEFMREYGVGEDIIRSTVSHCYGIMTDVRPEHEMEKILYATDELTGLIGATALMRPSKSVRDLEVQSVKKKFKMKSFAAGCSREVIENGAQMLGWDLDKLIGETILAMRTIEGM